MSWIVKTIFPQAMDHDWKYHISPYEKTSGHNRLYICSKCETSIFIGKWLILSIRDNKVRNTSEDYPNHFYCLNRQMEKSCS